MSLTRRGFLGILGTAFSTSMVLGPGKLWVPEPKAISVPDLRVEHFTMSEIDQIVNTQGELAELAKRCAIQERTMATCRIDGRAEWGTMRVTAEDAIVSDMAEKFGRFEMFAPLGVDLRPGVPFDKKMLVGIGQDPSTGLTVRALKFEHARGRDRADQMIAIEVGGGVLYNRERGTRRSMSARKLIV